MVPSYFSVIQFVPDPIADERINVGVIAYNQSAVRARFLTAWHRVRQFGLQDVTFLRDFARKVAFATNADLPLSGLPSHVVLDRQRIEQMAGSWMHSIQVTSPRASLRSLEDTLTEAYDRFLADRSPIQRNFRDRRSAAGLAAASLREALQVRVGPVDAERLVKKHGSLEGARQAHRFDAVVRNGSPYLAASGVSFETPEIKNLELTLNSLAWAVSDVKAIDSRMPIAIVTLPPRQDDSEESSGARRLYGEFSGVYAGLGADVVSEEHVAEWARAKVATLPFGPS